MNSICTEGILEAKNSPNYRESSLAKNAQKMFTCGTAERKYTHISLEGAIQGQFSTVDSEWVAVAAQLNCDHATTFFPSNMHF